MRLGPISQRDLNIVGWASPTMALDKRIDRRWCPSTSRANPGGRCPPCKRRSPLHPLSIPGNRLVEVEDHAADARPGREFGLVEARGDGGLADLDQFLGIVRLAGVEAALGPEEGQQRIHFA